MMFQTDTNKGWRSLLYKVLTFYEVPTDNKLSQEIV
jgi:hypothetical protein